MARRTATMELQDIVNRLRMNQSMRDPQPAPYVVPDLQAR